MLQVLCTHRSTRQGEPTMLFTCLKLMKEKAVTRTAKLRLVRSYFRNSQCFCFITLFILNQGSVELESILYKIIITDISIQAIKHKTSRSVTCITHWYIEGEPIKIKTSSFSRSEQCPTVGIDIATRDVQLFYCLSSKIQDSN